MQVHTAYDFKSFESEDGLQNHLEELTCKFYKSLPETSVKTARYNLFKLGKFSDARLPPNKDCLVKHIQRANYQAAIWKCSTCHIINAPSPSGHGWSIDGSGNISTVHQMHCYKITTASAKLGV